MSREEWKRLKLASIPQQARSEYKKGCQKCRFVAGCTVSCWRYQRMGRLGSYPCFFARRYSLKSAVLDLLTAESVDARKGVPLEAMVRPAKVRFQ